MMSTINKWDKKKEQIEELTNKMEKEIDNYFETPEQMEEYLTFMSKFRQYSPRNIAMIRSQFSSAIALGSFKFWKDKGFSVNKGEKGIKLFVPNKTAAKFQDESGKWRSMKYANDKQKELVNNGDLKKKVSQLYFNMGHVFDVSQTNTKASDLPDIFPNRWMEGEVDNYDALFQSFEKIATDMNVTIGAPFEELGNAKGAFYHAVNQGSRGHIALNPRNSELQNVKTMIHELAHAKLHSGKHAIGLSDAEKEFQAEMVAYSTAAYFNIDTSDYSLKYLANWSKGKEFKDKEKLLREVRDTSNEFVDEIEKSLVSEREMNKHSGKVLEEEAKKNKEYTVLEYGSFGEVKINSYNALEIEEKFLQGEPLTAVSAFNGQYKEKYTLIDADEINEPSIVIKWSEASHELPSNAIMPYVNANGITNRLTDDQDLGYAKTWYSILMPNKDGKVDVIPMDRLDIGDGMYNDIHHQVSKEAKKRMSDEQWKALNDAVMNSLIRVGEENTIDSKNKKTHENLVEVQR